MSNVRTFYKSKNGNEKLSNNFKVGEFACHDGTDKILIDMDMIPVLQKIRDLGGAVTINSAYRTEYYNRKCGGATNSYHLKGQAFDIRCANLSLDNLCRVAKALGVKGIIRYDSFVHIDSRTTKYYAKSTGAAYTIGAYTIPFVETIKLGSKGTNVGVVQFKLNKLGFACGNADCDCGNKTIAAIKEFQKANGLVSDGICGKRTWNKLFN